MNQYLHVNAESALQQGIIKRLRIPDKGKKKKKKKNQSHQGLERRIFCENLPLLAPSSNYQEVGA